MQALRLVDLYSKKGFDLSSKRIYIKVHLIIRWSTPSTRQSQVFQMVSLRLVVTAAAANIAIFGERTAPGLTLHVLQIASTWEGIRACEILQKQGIDTNMTLLFSFAQVHTPAHIQ